MGMRRTKQLVLRVLLKALSAKKYVNNFIKKNIFRQFETHLFDEFSKKASKYNLTYVSKPLYILVN